MQSGNISKAVTLLSIEKLHYLLIATMYLLLNGYYIGVYVLVGTLLSPILIYSYWSVIVDWVYSYTSVFWDLTQYDNLWSFLLDWGWTIPYYVFVTLPWSITT